MVYCGVASLCRFFFIVRIFMFGRWMSKGNCSDSINWFGFLNEGHSILRSNRFFQRCRVRVIVEIVNFLFPLLYIFLYVPINFDLWDQSRLIEFVVLIDKQIVYVYQWQYFRKSRKSAVLLSCYGLLYSR